MATEKVNEVNEKVNEAIHSVLVLLPNPELLKSEQEECLIFSLALLSRSVDGCLQHTQFPVIM